MCTFDKCFELLLVVVDVVGVGVVVVVVLVFPHKIVVASAKRCHGRKTVQQYFVPPYSVQQYFAPPSCSAACMLYRTYCAFHPALYRSILCSSPAASFIHTSTSISCSLLQLARRPDVRDHVYEGGQGGAGSCGFLFPSRPTLLEPRCDTAVSPRRSVVQLLHLYSTFYTASL
ncbi:unnamed protein product, partial [Pylaiella littoralis]